MTVEPSAVTPPADAYRLTESVALREGALGPDNTVTLQVLRPCVGKGKGRGCTSTT
jgi:hypothetical protein